MTTVAVDNFSSGADLNSPMVDVYIATVSDANELPFVTRAIRCSAAATLNCVMVSGRTVALLFAAGETRNVRARQIKSTGSTVGGAVIECMA